MADGSNVKIPYKEGTKKFLVAQRILSGDEDADKIARELGVKKDTVYVVKSEIKRRMSGEASGKSEASGKGLTEGLPSEVTGKVTSKASEGSKGAEVTPETVRAIVSEAIRPLQEALGRLTEGASGRLTASQKVPEGATPMGEEVEVKGEKINYKVALNPEIFYLYSIFKAEAERRGNKWDGDFGDFLYMAAKDLLTVHGLRPAVVAVKEGTLMLKMPVEEE
jgi:hypothetical protein